LRIPPRLQPLKPRAAPFTTTTNLSAKPVKAKGPPPSSKTLLSKQKTQSNKVRIKKKVFVAPKPAYEEGERKMLRHRIVLSNTNAVPVELPEMTEELVGNLETAGSVFALTDTILDKLRALEVFETTQHWPFFHRPSTLIRTETTLIGVLLDNVDKLSKGEQLHLRYIIDGYYGSGRSILLLQAMTWALQKNWIVISIPNGKELSLPPWIYFGLLLLTFSSDGLGYWAYRIRVRCQFEFVVAASIYL
jgi:small subunit ribosomal protein S29